jgi:hypothetical protein
MPTPQETLIDLETKFWQSIVDQDTDTALDLLSEPALMVSTHGAMKFDHEEYRRMAEKGSMVLAEYQLSDIEVVFPTESTAVLTYHVKQKMTPRGADEGTVEEMNDTSTWVKTDGRWRCVMHTETPANGAQRN